MIEQKHLDNYKQQAFQLYREVMRDILSKGLEDVDSTLCQDIATQCYDTVVRGYQTIDRCGHTN